MGGDAHAHGGHGLHADPIFNGSKVVRSIQMMRSYHRLPVGPEPPHLKIRGAPLHPWSMYTDKGGFFFGVGTQLPRNFFPKFLATTSAIMGVTYGLVWLYNAAGPRAKTQTRKWKELESEDPRFPFQEIPEIYLPSDIDRDPNADCWRILNQVPRKEKLLVEITDPLRNFDFKVAKIKEN
uniref:COX4 n=1 Tax=Euglena gracilis TaxID=3039 RepID=UPI002FE4FB23